MFLNLTGLRAMSAALIFSVVAMPVRAQVSVLLNPQPVSVSRSVGITMADVWTVRACNDGTANVTVAPERIYAEVPNIFFLEASESQVVLSQSHLHNRRVKIARYLEGAVLLATVITGGGVVAASPKVVVALGLSTTAAHQIGDMIQGVAPDLTAISANLLNEPLTLGPGGCATRLALANIDEGAKPVSILIP